MIIEPALPIVSKDENKSLILNIFRWSVPFIFYFYSYVSMQSPSLSKISSTLLLSSFFYAIIGSLPWIRIIPLLRIDMEHGKIWKLWKNYIISVFISSIALVALFFIFFGDSGIGGELLLLIILANTALPILFLLLVSSILLLIKKIELVKNITYIILSSVISLSITNPVLLFGPLKFIPDLFIDFIWFLF